MKVGIMQPYFFPYLGYFQLINYVDKWICYDDVQYINYGWMNRNRVLHPKEGWLYIRISLIKHSSKDLIKYIQVNNDVNWREKIISQLYHYKKLRAPYYDETMDLLSKCFDTNEKYLVNMNLKIIKVICDYLDIDFNYQISSKSNFDYSYSNTAQDRVISICKKLQADEYINPIGGYDLYNSDNFNKNNINLKFLKMNDIVYSQKRSNFEPGLSIIDVLMFNSKEDIKNMLNLYEVYSK